MTVSKEKPGDRVYVLKEKPEYARSTRLRYYTGKKPADNIANAKRFTFDSAKGACKFAHTGWLYNITVITPKMKFKLALQGI